MAQGGLFEKPVEVADITVAPSERVEVLVRGTDGPGSRFVAFDLPYDRYIPQTRPATWNCPRKLFSVRYTDEPPSPLPTLVAHVLELPSRDAALNCQQVLPDGQVRDSTIRRETAETWILQSFYPELPPDPEFKEREQALRRVVAGFAGRYSGSQRPTD